MTFEEFESLVRNGVDDAISSGDDSAATWSTAEIAEYTNDGIYDYSQHFPLQTTATIVVTAGTSSYSLPSDIIQPPDTSLEIVRWRKPGYLYDHLEVISWPPGSTEAISVAGTGKGYYIWGDNLILADSPSVHDAQYDIEIWYRAVHPLIDTTLTGDDLAAETIDIPQADRSLMFWYVTAVMMGKLEASDAFLRQYADREDLGVYRDDSPPRKSASWRMERYDSGIALRKGKRRQMKVRR